jgi:predicted nucleic acid-binding protein
VSGFLLDTSVISELVKPKPDPAVTGWIDATDESLLCLSVLTLGEIRKGISSLPHASRRASLETWLDHDLVLRFAGRILAIDQAVADRWGRMAAKALGGKSPFPVIDGLLAATAMQHNLTLVTRNTKDVAVTDVAVCNPGHRDHGSAFVHLLVTGTWPWAKRVRLIISEPLLFHRQQPCNTLHKLPTDP